tara:strand:- start:157 stop:1431 length:1275 start_codon:yes stop_codon:yes gene_type:complete
MAKQEKWKNVLENIEVSKIKEALETQQQNLRKELQEMSNEMQDQNRLERFSEKRERIINWKTILLDLLPKDKKDDTYTEKLAHFIEMEYSILHATLELHKRSLVRFLKELKFSDEEQYLALLPGKKNADIDDNIEKKRQVEERIQMMENVFPGIEVIKIPEEGFHSTSASSSSEDSSSPSPSPPSSDKSGNESPRPPRPPVAKAVPFQEAVPEATSLPSGFTIGTSPNETRSSSKKNKSRDSSSQTRKKRPPPKGPPPQKMRKKESEEYWSNRKATWAEWSKTQEEKERERTRRNKWSIPKTVPKIGMKRPREPTGNTPRPGDKVFWMDGNNDIGYEGGVEDNEHNNKNNKNIAKKLKVTKTRKSSRLANRDTTPRQPSARGQTRVLQVRQNPNQQDFTKKGGRKKKKRRKNKKGGRRTRKRSK